MKVKWRTASRFSPIIAFIIAALGYSYFKPENLSTTVNTLVGLTVGYLCRMWTEKEEERHKAIDAIIKKLEVIDEILHKARTDR